MCYLMSLQDYALDYYVELVGSMLMSKGREMDHGLEGLKYVYVVMCLKLLCYVL